MKAPSIAPYRSNRLPSGANVPNRRSMTIHRSGAVSPQGCNWFKCGALVVTCALECASGVGSVACIGCLGSAYSACKDCF